MRFHMGGQWSCWCFKSCAPYYIMMGWTKKPGFTSSNGLTEKGTMPLQSHEVDHNAKYFISSVNPWTRQMANEHTEVSPPAGATGVPATETDIPQQTRDMGQAIMTKEDVIDFMDFRPNDLNKVLEVNVYRKWMLRNALHPNPIGLCFILLDKQMTSGIDRPTPHTNICISCSSPSAAHDTAPRVHKRVIHQTSDAGRYTRFNSNASNSGR